MSIFLCYRRDDSQEVVGRIYDRLIGHFSVDRVFRDIDNLAIGKPFLQALNDAIANASVALIVIGPTWTSIRNSERQRRLANPSDFVRLEVEKALGASIPVVPVLVSNATMPKQRDLPKSLRPLVLRHAVSVRPDPDFHHDMNRLIAKLSAFVDIVVDCVHPTTPDFLLSAGISEEPATNEIVISIDPGDLQDLSCTISIVFDATGRPLDAYLDGFCVDIEKGCVQLRWGKGFGDYFVPWRPPFQPLRFVAYGRSYKVCLRGQEAVIATDVDVEM